jgi:hypothetical protein
MAGGSQYLQHVSAIRRNYQQPDDVARGMEVGSQIGKSLSGFANAILAAKKDQLANQLMTDADIANQPGAGQTQDLGRLDDGSGDSGASSTSQASTPQDLGILPDDTSSPSLGINPDITPDGSGPNLSQAMTASRLGSGPTVGTVPALNQAITANRLVPPASGDNFTLNPTDYTGGGRGSGSVGEGAFPSGGGRSGTVGSLLHSGGTAELQQRQEFAKNQLADQLQRAKIADQIASTTGTGSYAKRATPVTRRGTTMTGGDSVWDGATGDYTGSGKKSKAAPKYEAGTEDFENNAESDNPDHIRTDFEAFHPGVRMSDFAGAARDDKGNYIIAGKPDSLGNPTTKATIPKAEGDVVMQRMDAARKRAGLPSNNGAVPAGFGTQDNPVPLSGSKLQLRSLATGTWVVDPKTGKKYRVGA